MTTKPIYFIMSLLMLGLLLTGTARADLVGWWRLDGNALDSSGNGHNGVLYGSPVWVPGISGQALQFAVGDRVEMPGTSQADGFPATGGAVTWTMWIKVPATGTQMTIMCQGPTGGAHVAGNRSINVETSGKLMLRANGVGALTSFSSAAVVNDDQWHHVAVVILFETSGTNDTAQIYIDGDLSKGYTVSTANINVNAAAGAGFLVTLGKGPATFAGTIDDVQIHNTALSLPEILGLMKPQPAARNVSPADGATDVPQDATLNWIADETAGTHDVYFGTTFADVNTADRTNPMDVLAGRDRTETTYDPAPLAYGRTYYWRIDEVNKTPDNTIFKGNVWSFTVEPFAYPLANVTATASSFQPGMGPENTVNGSGLDAQDQHAVEATQMWTTDGTKPDWIQFEFDNVYKLHEMSVWNSNQLVEAFIGLGARNVTVEYSIDGQTWTMLEGVPEFAQATGTPTYAANTFVDLGGVMARYVKLTINTNWGGIAQQTGLSEVRFFYVPLQAFEPQPAVGETDVSVDTELIWRPGREATSHDVYLGTDEAAVVGGAVAAKTVTEHSYTPAGLNYGTTYFWKIDEVGEAGSYEGDLWSFTTEEYAVVDDFESYDDDVDAETTIWHAWIDGLTDGKSGSQVGYDVSPFAERTVVYGGRQSMPLRYSNTAFAFSEAKLTFDSARNWTARGIKSLSLYFHGAADNGGELYVKINNTKVSYTGLANELRRTQWVPWTIDLAATGANLASVKTLTVGVEGAGASGIVYVDDIRLYPKAAESIQPVLPDDNDPNLAAHYKLDGNTKDNRGNYPGTAMGDPKYTAGKIGQAILLDNDDDYVVCTLTQEELWPACSVSLWVKTDLFSQDQYSSLFNNNSSSADFQIEMDGTNPGNYRYQGSAVKVLGPASSDWVHLAVSCDGAATRLYYNGLYVATLNVADTRFGQIALGINRGMNNRFGGVLDDVRVYNRAISDGEVLGLAGVTTAIPRGF